MQSNEHDQEKPADQTPSEAPLQALFPNLDKISRSSFKKGTISRSRIIRSLVGLVVVAAIIAVLIIASTLPLG